MTDPADARPGNWPIVGRDAIIDRALAWLDAGAAGGPNGVVLIGPAGIGKTSVADEIASRASAAGAVVERLVAGSSSATVPLMWLAPLNTSSGTARSREALARELDETARHRSPDSPLLVVLDDIHLLGDDDLELLSGLVRRRAIFLVATSRSVRAGLDSIDRLLADGSLVRVELGPLGRGELMAAAQQYLGGPLSTVAADHLSTASAGVPLFARELVMVNLAAGVLTRDAADLWTLSGSAVVPPSLLDLLADRSLALGEERRRVLEVLAVAQPLPTETLDQLGLDEPVIDVLADLEDLGVVEARREQDALMLRLAHPLYADAVLSRCGPLRRRAVAARALAALEQLPIHDADRELRITTFCIEHGLPVDDHRRANAAARALRQLDPQLALRLLDGIDDAGWESTYLRGSALAIDGRVDEADQVLSAALALAVDDEQRARTASRHAGCLTASAARHDAALAVLDRAAELITDPGWRTFLDADRAYVLLAVGASSTSLTDHTGTTGSATDRTGPARANECLVGAVVAAMDGRGAATEALVAEGLSLVHHIVDDVPSARELLTLSRFIWLATAGRAADANAIVETELDRADGHAALEGPWLAAAALQQLLAGDTVRAVETASRAASALVDVDVAGLRSMALATRSSALAQLDRPEDARACLEQIDPAWRAETKTRVLTARTEAWLLALSGATRRAASLVTAAAQEALEGRHAPFALFGAHDAARIGHPSIALPVLRDAAARCEGRLAQALLEHAMALDAGDAAGLLRSAEELPRLGFTLSGAEAATAAADRFDASRRSIDAVRARAVAGRLLDQLGPVRSPGLGRATALTDREREIAALAARRHRSREIADLLGISVRTVDNHLVTVYRKLGISGRRDLAHHFAEAPEPHAGRPHAPRGTR